MNREGSFKDCYRRSCLMLTGAVLCSMGTALWNYLSPAYFSDIRETSRFCFLLLHVNCHRHIFRWKKYYIQWSLIMKSLLSCLWQAQHFEIQSTAVWVTSEAILWSASYHVYFKHNTLNSIHGWAPSEAAKGLQWYIPTILDQLLFYVQYSLFSTSIEVGIVFI